MPWKESCAMDERMRFIAARLTGLHTMIELCEASGISRKTGYKWWDRYQAEGAAGLEERSHAPHRPGHVTPAAIAERIIALRQAHPSWGPCKIIGFLHNQSAGIAWPAPSTAGEILKRAGLVTARRPRRRAPPRLDELCVVQEPNHVWGVDHKGWIRLRNGWRCEPLTITDTFSRYLIAVAATGSTGTAEARPVFERAFREHGLPDVLRSDNGAPFAAASASGLTALSVWWAKLGIGHERIDPGKPQQNGRHERFHRTLLEAMQPPCADQAAQERRFEAFRAEYNEQRPHEALGQKPPASFYQPSPRPLPERLPEPDYPAHAEVRRVRSTGEIKWRGEFVWIGEPLAGEWICLNETEAGDWQVRFYNAPVGIIDRATNRLQSMKPNHKAERRKYQ